MRNVIVTGGSRGLGLGIAEKLSASGFGVIAVARTQTDMLTAAMAAAADGPGAIRFHAYDLTDTAGLPALVKELRKAHGPLYGLVNNAGIGNGGVLANMPDQVIERLTRLNITSPLTLSKYVVRAMMTGDGGRIVNMASVVAFTGYTGLAAYSATKAAMIGFTRSLAREVGPLGITVNAIAPGFIGTEMTDELTQGHRDQIAKRSALKRMAEVADVANAVDFLFSEGAKNITGTVMTVDAGNTA